MAIPETRGTVERNLCLSVCTPNWIRGGGNLEPPFSGIKHCICTCMTDIGNTVSTNTIIIKADVIQGEVLDDRSAQKAHPLAQMWVD